MSAGCCLRVLLSKWCVRFGAACWCRWRVLSEWCVRFAAGMVVPLQGAAAECCCQNGAGALERACWCHCRVLFFNAAVGMACALSSGHVGAAARYRFMVPLQVVCALWSRHAGAAARCCLRVLPSRCTHFFQCEWFVAVSWKDAMKFLVFLFQAQEELHVCILDFCTSRGSNGRAYCVLSQLQTYSATHKRHIFSLRHGVCSKRGCGHDSLTWHVISTATC